jgi:hypothetical protein
VLLAAAGGDTPKLLLFGTSNFRTEQHQKQHLGQGCQQHTSAQQGARSWLQAAGGPAGLLLQHAASHCHTQNIEMYKTRYLQIAKPGRANITSAQQHCNAITEAHTSLQCMVNPAAAVRCKHTFYVSLEAAQQGQNTQIPAVS